LKSARVKLRAADDGVGRCLDQSFDAVGSLRGGDAEATNDNKILTFHKAIETKFVEQGGHGGRRSGRWN